MFRGNIINDAFEVLFEALLPYWFYVLVAVVIAFVCVCVQSTRGEPEAPAALTLEACEAQLGRSTLEWAVAAHERDAAEFSLVQLSRELRKAEKQQLECKEEMSRRTTVFQGALDDLQSCPAPRRYVVREGCEACEKELLDCAEQTFRCGQKIEAYEETFQFMRRDCR